jgi:hypothetical protein
MVNLTLEPLLSDHVGYHILHWIVSQSGLWYSKVNENIQQNLRTIESGVAVIDEILTPQEDDFYFFENNELGDEGRHYRFYYHHLDNQHCHNVNVNRRDNCRRRVSDNENCTNQLHRNEQLLGI